MRDLIIIPARFGSKRLPGKPLFSISGRTLLDRVGAIARTAAAIAGNMDVVIATDDARIADHATTLGHDVALTSPDIASGSGRAYAAARMRHTAPGIVVNLQGDAPFIPADAVAALIAAARSSGAAATTPVVRLDWDALDKMRAHKQTTPFSGTTCVRRADGMALWFSKAILPAIRGEAALREAGPLSPVYRHLGLYAYRLDALEAFEKTPPTPYEQAEGLEQLRFLETGRDIMTIEIPAPRYAISGIDTQADVDLAERLIRELGDPYPA